MVMVFLLSPVLLRFIKQQVAFVSTSILTNDQASHSIHTLLGCPDIFGSSGWNVFAAL
jgi:hypothetical protein